MSTQKEAALLGALGAPKAALAPEWIACPECSGRFNQGSSRLRCVGCGREWPIIDGVPHFVADFPYWGEMPLQQMREVNRAAAVGSWRSALTDSADPAVQRAAGMILNLERANWQWLVDLPRESRVLDVGAGTGTNSHALGCNFNEVVALEPVLERVEFMRHRFSQERLSNVKLVRSSLWTLPFQPGSFDLIAMNGVLEWVPEGRSEDPRELQELALTNMLKLLRPGGILYVGIENRACPEYLLGYLDPHCRLPFVTLLPRPLAHWYARRHGRQHGYRNYLYSSAGYQKLLRKVGFEDTDVYAALPSYNHPRYFMPLRNNIFNYYSRNFNPMRSSAVRALAHECLLRTGALKYMQDSFAILARKAA
jgi:SAM-dependent methyltransferase